MENKKLMYTVVQAQRFKDLEQRVNYNITNRKGVLVGGVSVIPRVEYSHNSTGDVYMQAMMIEEN